MTLIGVMESKAALQSNLKKLKKGTYDENLALYRIEFCKETKPVKKQSSVPLIFPLNQARRLEERLAQRKVAYEHINLLKGYTIQLYMGSSRTEALKAKDLISSLVYPSELSYRQPHYTVELGFFSDRLEAYLVCLTLKKKIPSAMIRPCMCTRQVYLDAILYRRESVPSQQIVHGLLSLK